MAVVNQLTTIHSCEQITDAVTSCVLTSTGGGSFVTGTGEYVEGSAAYAFDLDIETHTVTFTPTASLNLTSQVVWAWLKFLTAPFLDSWANGGVSCRLNDGTNWSEWYLGGYDRFVGGYVRVPFYVGSTPDVVSGTLSTGAVTSIVFYFTGLTKSKLPENVFVDFIQYGAVGSGIKVTGGGLGTEETFSDVYGDDVTAAAGMLDYADGVYFMNGPITFGDTATNSIYFLDTNQLIVSKDNYRTFTTTNRTSAESLVASNHYQFIVQNYAAGTANFTLGEAAGGRGASGCVFKSGGNRKISFDFNDTDIDILKLYACLFIDCGTTTFPTAISGSEVYDCTWNLCDVVTPSTFKIRYSNFVNANSNGIILSSASMDVQYCNFTNPTDAGIDFTASITVAFVSMKFVGTDGISNYDVSTTSSTVTINADSVSDPAYKDEGTGSITIVNTKTLTLTCKNQAGNPIEGVRVRIEKESDGTEISQGTTNASGIYSDATYNYAGDVDVKVIARLKGYKNNAAFDTITTSGLSVPLTMVTDSVVNLP